MSIKAIFNFNSSPEYIRKKYYFFFLDKYKSEFLNAIGQSVNMLKLIE